MTSDAQSSLSIVAPMSLADVVLHAINRRKIVARTLSAIASECKINVSDLSRYVKSLGESGLSAPKLDQLCNYLGIRFRYGRSGGIDASLLNAIQCAIRNRRVSLRSLQIDTGLDPGNLSRFVNGRRRGLTIRNIERLMTVLNIEAFCTTQLNVRVSKVVRDLDDWSEREEPLVGATVECWSDDGANNSYAFHKIKAVDQTGRVSFRVPLDALVSLVVDELPCGRILVTNIPQFHDLTLKK